MFDDDDSGNLNFSEYIQVRASVFCWVMPTDGQANSVKNLNTPQDKLGWMFDAFDADGGGTVDAEEITSIVVGLFRSVEAGLGSVVK